MWLKKFWKTILEKLNSKKLYLILILEMSNIPASQEHFTNLF